MNALVGMAALVYTARNIGPIGWLALVMLTALAIALVWWLWVYVLLAAVIVGTVFGVSRVMR